MRVWLPEPAEMFEGLPDGLDVDVYDGSGDPPASIAQVEFYVTPYMAGPHTVTFLQEMPALKVVQTLTAGVDHILPLVP
ncbi:MAG TPA: dihydrofolate reductase, partial [Actinopolymorphaceae bacterium]